MVFLPIVERELRVASRRGGTYWIRMGVAVIGLVIGGFIMLIPGFRSPQALGMALFSALAVVTYIYAILAGLRSTADCLSEEKREGTLGLLFLTDLKGYDIVLGKLAATSVNVLYGILAIFPVLAIPLLVGGVTIAEFQRVALVALNNLFFSLAVGLFASSISRDERKAALATFLIILLFTAGLPFLGAMTADWGRHRPSEFFFLPSPGYACFMAFDQLFARTGRNYFYASLGCVHAISWGFLILSCFIVPRTWQDKAESSGRSRRRLLWQRLSHGDGLVRRALRVRLLEINPFYWLVARDRVKVVLVWVTLGMGGLLWTWGLLFYPRDWLSPEAYIWTALLLHTLLKCWLASEAARRFASDRRSGALELLLSTPLSVRSILRGQILGLQRQFGAPILLTLVLDFIFVMTDFRDGEWLWVWIAGMVIFVADVVALTWVGMWMGLRSSNPNRAAAAAIVRIMVLPWVVFLGFMAIGSAMVFAGPQIGPTIFDDNSPTAIWLLIGLIIDVAFGLYARQKLQDEFRTTATERFDKPARGRWFGSPGQAQET